MVIQAELSWRLAMTSVPDDVAAEDFVSNWCGNGLLTPRIRGLSTSYSQSLWTRGGRPSWPQSEVERPRQMLTVRC
jgi:hypothetical protein